MLYVGTWVYVSMVCHVGTCDYCVWGLSCWGTGSVVCHGGACQMVLCVVCNFGVHWVSFVTVGYVRWYCVWFVIWEYLDMYQSLLVMPGCVCDFRV